MQMLDLSFVLALDCFSCFVWMGQRPVACDFWHLLFFNLLRFVAWSIGELWSDIYLGSGVCFAFPFQVGGPRGQSSCLDSFFLRRDFPFCWFFCNENDPSFPFSLSVCFFFLFVTGVFFFSLSLLPSLDDMRPCIKIRRGIDLPPGGLFGCMPTGLTTNLHLLPTSQRCLLEWNVGSSVRVRQLHARLLTYALHCTIQYPMFTLRYLPQDGWACYAI
ncbi:hypothetical protein FN846DRAFT_735198 [Sphaerosporella brunnea]|uniref:Uncharacterized protein n=1 Tax=Sphaerosporella brunnea TaxID=1250544 RepID=A0A5J5EVX2_9PEZI|nr:hypothetical protein FN846DRAFT_735198 [Sphaerosporella brunnea]